MSDSSRRSLWEQMEAHRKSQIVEVREIIENGQVVGQIEVDSKGTFLGGWYCPYIPPIFRNGC